MGRASAKKKAVKASSSKHHHHHSTDPKPGTGMPSQIRSRKIRPHSRIGNAFKLGDFDVDIGKDFQDAEEPEEVYLNAKITVSHNKASGMDQRLFDLLSPDVRRLNVVPKKKFSPVVKIANMRRFRLSEADQGKILKLKTVDQYPLNYITGKPLFELKESSKLYEAMEEEMDAFYSSMRDKPVIEPGNIFKGLYAVAETQRKEYKRVKVTSSPSFDVSGGILVQAQVEYLDSYGKTYIDSSNCLLYLDEKYGHLPPRVTAIEMEGMEHYEDSELFRRFVRRDSDEFLLEEELTAQVQASGKVVLWSGDFPREKYPNGINGFIVESIVELLPVVQLPPEGVIRAGFYVVDADEEGNVSLQMDTIMNDHFHKVFDAVTDEQIEGLKGSVGHPLLPEEVYLAPRTKSGGTYQRAMVISQGTETVNAEEVQALYMDYGDQGISRVSDLVKASGIHFLLKLVPPLHVKAHLDNVWSLKTLEFLDKNLNKEFSICVSKAAYSESTGMKVKHSASVVLYERDENKGSPRCVNKELIEQDMANPIDNFCSFDDKKESVDISSMGGAAKLYLGLGAGRRLQIGDELLVVLSYCKTLEGRGQLFMVPKSRLGKREEMEKGIGTYYYASMVTLNLKGERLMMTTMTKTQRDRGQITPYPGWLILARSEKLGRCARAIAVSCNEDKLKKADPSFQKEHIKWRVYFLDHGYFESVCVESMISPRSQDRNPPALGIRAMNSKWGSKGDVEKWWRMFKSKNETKLKTVKIEGIDMDKFGEMAKVSWTPEEWEVEGEGLEPAPVDTPVTTKAEHIPGFPVANPNPSQVQEVRQNANPVSTPEPIVDAPAKPTPVDGPDPGLGGPESMALEELKFKVRYIPEVGFDRDDNDDDDYYAEDCDY